MSQEAAKDRAARLLKKRGSISSQGTSQRDPKTLQRHGSMSTISFMDEPREDAERPSVRMENTYQLAPGRKFPSGAVKRVVKEVLEGYLCEEKYEPELCRQMTKTLSEVVKARVKELMIPRYKVICLIHIGSCTDQGLRVGSRCLWDASSDTFASYEFRNNSLFAIGTVYAIYTE